MHPIQTGDINDVCLKDSLFVTLLIWTSITLVFIEEMQSLIETLVWVYPPAFNIIPSWSEFCNLSIISPSWLDWK